MLSPNPTFPSHPLQKTVGHSKFFQPPVPSPHQSHWALNWGIMGTSHNTFLFLHLKMGIKELPPNVTLRNRRVWGSPSSSAQHTSPFMLRLLPLQNFLGGSWTSWMLTYKHLLFPPAAVPFFSCQISHSSTHKYSLFCDVFPNSKRAVNHIFLYCHQRTLSTPQSTAVTAPSCSEFFEDTVCVVCILTPFLLPVLR